MLEEADAQRFNRRLHAVAQMLQGARATVFGLFHPFLEPAIRWALRLDARLMAEQPEHAEIAVGIAIHHRFEVELDVGLPRQRQVVAQDSQLVAVADEPPEMVVAAVQEALQQAMWTGR